MKTTRDEYIVEHKKATKLSQKDLDSCIAIIKQGKAVDWESALRELPVANIVILARKGTEIVGIGAIKRKRLQYAARVARDAQYAFPPDTLELGYVAVDTAHRRQGLSHRITNALLSKYDGRLFATTYDKRMKRTLKTAGFVKKGKRWKGQEYMLSYWERSAEA
jgi:GNAT superfamily N-acetyltransferase